MGVGNTFLLTQITALLLLFIASFFIFVPMSQNLTDFDGNCLLYARGTWDTNTSQLVQIDWGKAGACNFSVFVGIGTMMLALFYLILNCIYLVKNIEGAWLETFIMLVLTVMFTIMLFASALNVSVGFKKWCSLVTSPQSQIVSCELADFIPFDKEIANINSSSFYTEMTMTEFGSWSCFTCWLVLALMSAVKMLRLQKHETFMANVSRERQRLLQRVRHGPDYTV